jgi:hypothetical protein
MATAEMTRVLGFKSLSLHACFVDVFKVSTDVPFFVVPHVHRRSIVYFRFCPLSPRKGGRAPDFHPQRVSTPNSTKSVRRVILVVQPYTQPK